MLQLLLLLMLLLLLLLLHQDGRVLVVHPAALSPSHRWSVIGVPHWALLLMMLLSRRCHHKGRRWLDVLILLMAILLQLLLLLGKLCIRVNRIRSHCQAYIRHDSRLVL